MKEIKSSKYALNQLWICSPLLWSIVSAPFFIRTICWSINHSSFQLYHPPIVELSRFLGICHPLHYPPHTRYIFSLLLLLCPFLLDQLVTKFQKILVLHSPCSRRINPCQYTKGGDNTDQHFDPFDTFPIWRSTFVEAVSRSRNLLGRRHQCHWNPERRGATFFGSCKSSHLFSNKFHLKFSS